MYNRPISWSVRLALLVSIVAVGLIGGAATGLADASTGEQTAVSENVSVWTEATLAMDLKHPDDTPTVESPLVAAVPSRTIAGETSSGSSISGTTNQPAATAVSPGSLLQIEFWNENGANTEQFAGTNTSMVVAAVDSPADPAVDGTAELSAVRAAELLAVDDRNDRASFETQFTEDGTRDMRVVDDDGYFPSYYGIDETADSGLYALYVIETVDGEGVSTENGALTIDGDISVLGIQTIAVHDAESTVTVDDSAVAGETVEFEASASGDSVDHTVAVFDESALADETQQLRTDQPVDTLLEPDAVDVTSSVGVHGVADTEPATVFGSQITAHPASQATDLGMLTTYLSTADSDADGPAGSITATTGANSTETLGVETLESWESGSYRYIHVGTASDGTTTTTSGSIQLDEPDDSASTSTSRSGGSSRPLETTTTTTETATQLSVDYANGGDQLAIDIGSPANSTLGSTLTALETNIVRTVRSFDAEIGHAGTVPPHATDHNTTLLSYHDINSSELSSSDYGVVTFEFTVDDELLAQLDADPSDVRLYQHDTEWSELDTEQVGEHRYEASTTQLSSVAVGTIESAEESLTVQDATLSSTTTQPNESVSATATVDNPTADAVAAEIELIVDGAVVETIIETVPADGSHDVSFEIEPETAGNYTVSVADSTAGTLEVRESSTEDETPGFGVVITVVSLVAMGVGLRRLDRR